MKSDGVKEFLASLRNVGTENEMAIDRIKECDAKTQDILHFIELHECSVSRNIEYSEQLADIRRQRRNAKDETEVLQHLIGWIRENKKAINTLSEVLGQMRKTEKKHENRIYYPRALGR